MRILIIFLSILISFCGKAQNTLDSITGVKDFAVDALSNTYILRGTEILKIDTAHRIVLRAGIKEYGTPTVIDARDPLRLLVFYADFATIRILDNQLSEQSVIDLRSMGYIDPRSVCGSVDQGIWIFDQTTNRLTKLDVKLNRVSTTLDLNLLLNHAVNATRIEQSSQYVVLQESENLYLFDQFGSYIRKIVLGFNPVLLQINDLTIDASNSEQAVSSSLRYAGLEEKKELLLPSGTRKAIIYQQKKWNLIKDTLYFP